MPPSPSVLEALSCHIGLPPKLPGSQDKYPEKINNELIIRLLDTVKQILNIPGVPLINEWSSLFQSLDSSRKINEHGALSKTSVISALQDITESNFVYLYVAEQNCGVTVRLDQCGDDKVLNFEVSEASARSEKVLASQNALQWDFPTSAVAIPFSLYHEHGCEDEIANFLEKASKESVKHFAAHTVKANFMTHESRDTVDPAVISVIFTTILASNGKTTYPPLLRKRVRDDVCWNGRGERPWRRSPFWLLLRVAVQRYLCLAMGPELGRLHFKLLMCLFHSRFLSECTVPNSLAEDALSHLHKKLVVRMEKLTSEEAGLPKNSVIQYHNLRSSIDEHLYSSAESASLKVTESWKSYKESCSKKIGLLPYIAPKKYCDLRLLNSRSYTDEALSSSVFINSDPKLKLWEFDKRFIISSFNTKPKMLFADKYFKLAELESDMESELEFYENKYDTNSEIWCPKIADKIRNYLRIVGNAYDENPEQKSQMLLLILEHWVKMDKCVTQRHSLLKEFNSGIPQKITDVLQLARLKDLERLQEIRRYLIQREKASGFSNLTIFDQPSQECFAVRYFDASTEESQMRSCLSKIEAKAWEERNLKKREWEEKNEKYAEIAAIESSLEHTSLGIHDHGLHDRGLCVKCYQQRVMKRFEIAGHEWPLPTDEVPLKTVLFELHCPEDFAAYRDLSWQILTSLAFTSSRSSKANSQFLLSSDQNLSKFGTTRRKSTFTLASRTKTFMMTHFRSIKFPVRFSDICVPNGAKFAYYDSEQQLWSFKLQPLSFAHHCKLSLTADSVYFTLRNSPEILGDMPGPSSYSIVASRSNCPSRVSIQEYLSLLALFTGSEHRWLNILIELGSSNINFSTESVASIMNLLALRIGPYDEENIRGLVHRVFLKQHFCSKLMDLIDQRMDDISSKLKWREVYTMEILITLLIRVHELAVPNDVKRATDLIEKARKVTMKWITRLRSNKTRDNYAEAMKTRSHYTLWAALLCRRTFTIFKDKLKFSSSQLQSFVESSIFLQDFLSEDTGAYSPLLKAALVRDLKMVWSIRSTIRASLNVKVLLGVIALHYPIIETISLQKEIQVEISSAQDKWWIQFTSSISTNDSTNQEGSYFHLNLLTGNLLVNGKPIGNLPEEWKQHVIHKQLFGPQALSVWPSPIQGMEYVLREKKQGNQVHFGNRAGNKVVRILNEFGEYLELLPAKIFSTSESTDLPSDLIEKRCHWLNLKKKMIEIRPLTNPWKYNPQYWLIDLQKRNASVYVSENNYCMLIDPHSRLFKAVAHIFKDFERPSEILLFQPTNPNSPMSVKLPRLELDFRVNERERLECLQLSSEIDPDQDAGTWYGLKSSLVMKDIVRAPNGQNRWSRIQMESRSILVPTGDVTFYRNGPHVDTKVANNGNYARFIINESLGRLDAVDPNHQYLKAFYHACTSFIIPDRLTGRTGAEEAYHCLNSGYCQPGMPLLEEQKIILRKISNLTPKRAYYPPHMKSMQVTNWIPTLTVSIQHDGYNAVAKQIYQESLSLSAFLSEDSHKLPDCFDEDEHLTCRNYVRRNLYDKLSNPDNLLSPADSKYSGYAIKFHAWQMNNVRICINLLRRWSLPLPIDIDLAKMLEAWSCFNGFSEPFNKTLLSEIFESKLQDYWGTLVNTFISSNQNKKYKLMFLLGIIAFKENDNLEAIITVIAFAISDELKDLQPPHWPSYSNFRRNEKPTAANLISLMGFSRETIFKEREVNREEVKVADFLLKQWPCTEPTVEGFPKVKYIDIAIAMDRIRPEWLRMYQNFELSSYIKKVQAILDKICSTHSSRGFKLDSKASHPKQNLFTALSRDFRLPKRFTDLLREKPHYEKLIVSQVTTSGRPDHIKDEEITDENSNLTAYQGQIISRPSLAPEIAKLENIISNFASSRSIIEKQYAKDLTNSLLALQNIRFKPQIIPQFDLNSLPQEIVKAKKGIQQRLKYIQGIIEELYPVERVKLLKQAGLWPRITPTDLLESLRAIAREKITPTLKNHIVNYGVSITHLQKLYRMQDAYLIGNIQRLNQELENHGHVNWDPVTRTDWLLLEIDGNILFRPDQIDVANATIFPPSGKNSVLQMNMGQGKTSCIMPMAAAILADGSNLLRVIVPRALLAQTLQLLQTRLAGLVGRKVKHIPFSRKISTRNGLSDEFFRQIKELKMVSGILVILPDHILSFKLAGQQALSDGRISEASNTIQAQKWISENSRDIIDECDEILSLHTQLIYPSGTQKIVDGHPFRWEIVEDLLKLVDYHLSNGKFLPPEIIAVTTRKNGSFPFLCFVHEESEELLISRLIDDICSGRSQIIPRYSSEEQCIIKEFISQNNLSETVVQNIKLISPENPKYLQAIYLLRGLFVQKILISCLKKRWNVQYGLHHQRHPIAVPFHAKGCPSDQSEWGHPDVAIILTFLSFYYEGISINQLRQTLEHVLKTGDPVQVYGRLTEGSSIPETLQDWTTINIEDTNQLHELWKHLCYSINFINFYLGRFVFPQHAKQFEIKIQASSWDIPASTLGYSLQSSKNMVPLSTGFSGTNDWKKLLPLTISQNDLPVLAHTNAEVLTYLLQTRNGNYFLAADSERRRLSEIGILKKITSLGVSVLLDAGAQIMEMNNYDLAKAWLNISPNKKAALYFDEENRPQILYKTGRHTPLYSSTFADNLNDCLVYLDQAHTRGTDLKLPTYAVGALSLGPGQTKDHTVQAAMRLRLLSSTQSIVFFAPPEVHRSITNLRKISVLDTVTSADIVFWLLKQTCIGIELLLPLYAAQGIEYLRCTQAAISYPELFNNNSRDRSDYLNIIRKIENFTLEELYGFGEKKRGPALIKQDPIVASFFKELKARCRGFYVAGKAYGNEALQEVEQEREVANEVQNIREVQKPVIYIPLKFPCLHAEIKSFVKNGLIIKNATGYEPAFKFIARTSVGKKYGVTTAATSHKLYVSIEFDRTVHLHDGSRAGPRRVDHLHRPVHWILWSPISEVAMVIIPEEVELILPMLRNGDCAIHLMSYAAPVTRKMLQFNDLIFFNLPPLSPTWRAPAWLRIELGILSGRLYFDQFEYNYLLEFLAVLEVDGKIIEMTKSFNFSTAAGGLGKEPTKFVSKPLLFLQEWLSLHRQGQDFSHTPMGFICQGRPVPADHPFFARIEKTCAELEHGDHGQDFFDFPEEQHEEQHEHFDIDILNHKRGEEPTTFEFKEESLLKFADLNLDDDE